MSDREAVQDVGPTPGAAGGPGWQPIETAPRDGTRVLISGGTVEYDASMAGATAFAGVTIASWRDGWWGGYGSEYDGEYWHEPTHWWPLPAAPVPVPDAPTREVENG